MSVRIDALNGIWDMGYGIWDMGYGIWDMGYGIWDIAKINLFYILTIYYMVDIMVASVQEFLLIFFRSFYNE